MYRLPEVNLLGSRGCYGGCTFCSINPFYGQGSGWRSRSPENIIAEIDGIISERGIRDFYFTDPSFFGPGKRGQDRAYQLTEERIDSFVEGANKEINYLTAYNA